jgi:hypothetical protein
LGNLASSATEDGYWGLRQAKALHRRSIVGLSKYHRKTKGDDPA